VDEFAKLLPGLPRWLSIPLILITVVAAIWPRIVQTIREGSKQRREYEFKKQNLELLRLRYEIEVLRKEHALLELPPEVIVPELVPVPMGEASKLSSRQRFFYGALGAVAPIIIQLLFVDVRIVFPSATTVVLVAYFIRLVLLTSLAGVTSFLLPRGISSRGLCFLTGLSMTLLLTLLLQYSARTQPERPVLQPERPAVMDSTR
jgi:hypothetical protein